MVVQVSGRPAAAAVFPGVTWQTRTPAEVGLDAAKLASYRNAASPNGPGVIIRGGYLVYSWGDASARGDWASAMKPVMSTLLFFAVHEGRLAGVDAKVRDWGWALQSKDREMTFAHLANMTSGYALPEAPGAAWGYNDYAITLYSKTLFDRVFAQAANDVAAAPNRLGPLQLQDGSFFGSRSGRGVDASPRDFARIGWFWLNRGNWRGAQLLPQRFFDDYVKSQVPASLPRTTGTDSNINDYLGVGSIGGGVNQCAEGPGRYGFNWWFGGDVLTAAPPDLFIAEGHGGREHMTIIPSQSLVVAYRGGQPNTGLNGYLRLLMEAVVRPWDETPPTPPVIQSAVVEGVTSVLLTWAPATDPESGVDGYLVYRDGALVATTAATSLAEDELEESTTYSYAVSAKNGAGIEGPRSSAVTVRTSTPSPEEPEPHDGAPGDSGGTDAASPGDPGPVSTDGGGADSVTAGGPGPSSGQPRPEPAVLVGGCNAGGAVSLAPLAALLVFGRRRSPAAH
ncbi:MAG: serine hydrolase [Deltaproteobacteria bacterium]|nr:serine hydrolase [Deltaproteobacteria bacterium]